MLVKYGGEIFSSYTNGEGCRTVFFLAGCNHGCPGCHNTHLWNMKEAQEVDINKLFKIIDKASIMVDGITLSGGDPFFQPRVTLELAIYAKDKGLNVWIYTGFTIEELRAKDNPLYNMILDNTDVLVDGKFVEELADPNLKYIGSSNQRIIKLKEG